MFILSKTWKSSQGKNTSAKYSCVQLPYQEFEKRLFRMEPVLGLVENSALRTVHHFVRNLLASIGRQTMERYGIRLGMTEQVCIYLVCLEFPALLFGFGFLSHAHPNVGV